VIKVSVEVLMMTGREKTEKADYEKNFHCDRKTSD
jgi:hypothetical protein